MSKIITVSREFGSGGRELGKRLADELGIAYFDKEILEAIAEKTKLIIPIGEKVMISTLRFLQRLAEQGIDDIVISVNISAIELLQPELDRAITGDIISMAHRLGHCAVAEGVEVEAQKQYLIAHGCDRMQGFLFSRALDEEAALALLKRDR